MTRSNNALMIAVALASSACGCMTPPPAPPAPAPQPIVVQVDDGRSEQERERRASRPLTNHPPDDVITLGQQLRDSNLTIGEFESIARVRVLPTEYEAASQLRVHEMDNAKLESTASSELVVSMVDAFRERTVENPGADAAAVERSYLEQTTRSREVARQLELLRRHRERTRRR